MIGAKKLTWNTCCQTSMAVSIEPSRAPPSALGEIAALLTSACSSPFVEPALDLVDRRERVVRVGEVDLDVVFRARRPTGSFPESGWREQVITRQPAAEKRFTVACPMPRLAPVSSSVRRGWFGWRVRHVVRMAAIRSVIVRRACAAHG